jgi:hypothetical protein
MLCRSSQPQSFLLRALAFNQHEHLPTLRYTATVIYRYQLSIPRAQSQRTHQEGRPGRVQVSWPCKLAVTGICLSPFPWFLLQPACSPYCSFVASLPDCWVDSFWVGHDAKICHSLSVHFLLLPFLPLVYCRISRSVKKPQLNL